MPDYSKAKIYRLVGGGHIYYGSTCYPLTKRKYSHRVDYTRWLSGTRSYITSFKCVEADDFDIVWVEDYPCVNKEQLRARERWWVENNECVNKSIPGRTQREWVQDNTDKVALQKKNWNKSNRDHILERQKSYNNNNKEHIRICRKIRRMFGFQGQ